MSLFHGFEGSLFYVGTEAQTRRPGLFFQLLPRRQRPSPVGAHLWTVQRSLTSYGTETASTCHKVKTVTRKKVKFQGVKVSFTTSAQDTPGQRGQFSVLSRLTELKQLAPE